MYIKIIHVTANVKKEILKLKQKCIVHLIQVGQKKRASVYILLKNLMSSSVMSASTPALTNSNTQTGTIFSRVN